MSDSLSQLVEEVNSRLSTPDAIPDEEIENHLRSVHVEYGVPRDEAVRSVVTQLTQTHDLDEESTSTGDGDLTPLATLPQIGEDEQVSVKVQLVDEVDNDVLSDSVKQGGTITDGEDTARLTVWSTGDPPTLETGTVYRLEDVFTSEYQGDWYIQVNRTSEVSALDEDLLADEEEWASDSDGAAHSFRGALVDIRRGSGLIKRCTADDDCSRVLQNGRCKEHGDVDGEFDLRVKATLDAGSVNRDIILGDEMVETLTDISLADAKEMAKDAIGTETVVAELTEALHGRYFEVETLSPLRDEFYVIESTELGRPSDGIDDEKVIKARSPV
jgi:replication factor A1